MTHVVLPLLAIAALILLNGLFVAAEFAIVASRGARLESGGRHGWAVSYLKRIVHSAPSKDRFIAIAQVGITLATIGLGMYGEPSIAGWVYEPLERALGLGEGAAHTVGTILAVLVLTYFHVVVGEMIPKALALQAPERTALTVARAMQLTGLALYPLVALLDAVGRGLLRLMGVAEGGEARLYTPAELGYLVQESHEEGAVSREEERLIRNILDFGERRVSQVMVPRLRIEALPLDLDWNDVLRIVREGPFSRYPVYRQDLDGIVGILHVKDVIERDLGLSAPDAERGSVRPELQTLLRRVPKVPETMPVDRLLASFKRLHVHMAVVVDEHGGTSGIVTLDDLLEEVVGDAGSEPGGVEVPAVASLGDGSFLVDGMMRLYQFNDRFDSDMQAAESTTIAGLVLERLKRAPKLGDEMRLNGFIVRVEELEGLTIRRLLVRRVEGESGSRDEVVEGDPSNDEG